MASLRPASAWICAAVLVSACDDVPVTTAQDQPPAPAQPPQPPPPAPATATATASASAAASASSPLPIASVEAVSKEPRKWLDYAGPEIAPAVKPGERAWAVVPVSVGWDTLKLRALDLARVEDHLGIFEVEENDQKIEFFVPGAFIAPVRAPSKPSPGTPVLASVHGSRAFARVVDAKDDKITVRFQFAGLVESAELEPRDLLELDGSLRFGAPVAHSETKEGARSERKLVWRPATFIQASEEKVWLITALGKPLRVPQNTVKALGVQLNHKAGDRVWVARGDELVPGKVVEPIDDALRYKIALDDQQEVTAGYENVAPPLR